jgi:hypothetical protein
MSRGKKRMGFSHAEGLVEAEGGGHGDVERIRCAADHGNGYHPVRFPEPEGGKAAVFVSSNDGQ